MALWHYDLAIVSDRGFEDLKKEGWVSSLDLFVSFLRLLNGEDSNNFRCWSVFAPDT